MSDTPRTECYVLNPLPQVVSAEFARELERELNAANDRIRRLEEAGDAMASILNNTRKDWYTSDQCEICAFDWIKAKEDKP